MSHDKQSDPEKYRLLQHDRKKEARTTPRTVFCSQNITRVREKSYAKTAPKKVAIQARTKRISNKLATNHKILAAARYGRVFDRSDRAMATDEVALGERRAHKDSEQLENFVASTKPQE